MSKCKKKKSDFFGFSREYSRKKDYPEKKPEPVSNKKIIIIVLIIVTVIISSILMFLSGYIAWNSFINDPVYIKISKTSVAIIFYPIYLFYVFMKSVIFQLP